MKFRIESGTIKSVANGIYVGFLVYDEKSLKKVYVPDTPKHVVPESVDLLDLTHQPKSSKRKWIRSTSVPPTKPDSLVEKMKLKFQQHL